MRRRATDESVDHLTRWLFRVAFALAWVVLLGFGIVAVRWLARSSTADILAVVWALALAMATTAVLAYFAHRRGWHRGRLFTDWRYQIGGMLTFAALELYNGIAGTWWGFPAAAFFALMAILDYRVHVATIRCNPNRGDRVEF